MPPDIIALGEPLLEFNAASTGPLHQVSEYQVGWGGDVSNFAVAVSRLGGSAGLISRVGDDAFGRMFLDLWATEEVDAHHVIVEANARTGIYFISREGAAHGFTYYRQNSAASHISKEDLPADWFRGIKAFHTSGITQAISESACEAALYAMEEARLAGLVVSYDPNIRSQLWGPHRSKAIVLESIRRADLVLPSLEDAQFLSDSDQPSSIADELLAMGPKAVALKMGPEGVLLATEKGSVHFEAYSVNVQDTSGAGDTFDAGFLVQYLAGRSLEECAKFANAAASLSSTGRGAVTPIPRFADVEAFLSRSGS